MDDSGCELVVLAFFVRVRKNMIDQQKELLMNANEKEILLDTILSGKVIDDGCCGGAR